MAKQTKQDMVRAAVAAGRDQPADGAAFVKATFGVDMTAKQFSRTKFVVAAKGDALPKRKPGRPRQEPATADAPAATSSPTPQPEPQGTGPRSPAELARQVKRLVGEYGADEVRAMLGVFAE